MNTGRYARNKATGNDGKGKLEPIEPTDTKVYDAKEKEDDAGYAAEGK